MNNSPSLMNVYASLLNRGLLAYRLRDRAVGFVLWFLGVITTFVIASGTIPSGIVALLVTTAVAFFVVGPLAAALYLHRFGAPRNG